MPRKWYLDKVDPHTWLSVTLILLALAQMAHAVALHRKARRLDELEWRLMCLESKVERRVPDPTGKNWRDSLHLTKYNWLKPPPF